MYDVISLKVVSFWLNILLIKTLTKLTKTFKNKKNGKDKKR